MTSSTQTFRQSPGLKNSQFPPEKHQKKNFFFNSAKNKKKNKSKCHFYNVQLKIALDSILPVKT